ncbi:autotransporter-associated beta strand repeat-containing protein [Bradyrhizobium diazoefficiens]|nr:autotransporter-associated beta strand repeat-containing protein [Bradyrhizobium diazoefficiens]WLA69682.1 autotransporter-associated beta strand repeat-containing protein [Bradyrhizobium diazoefficiens]
MTLSGANTYSGGTTINEGTTLVVGNGTALGSGALTLNGGTTGVTVNFNGSFSVGNNIVATGDPTYNVLTGNGESHGCSVRLRRRRRQRSERLRRNADPVRGQHL